MNLKAISKALAGGAAAAISVAIPLVADGLTWPEGLGIALAFLGGLGVVYVSPANKPAAEGGDA